MLLKLTDNEKYKRFLQQYSDIVGGWKWMYEEFDTMQCFRHF